MEVWDSFHFSSWLDVCVVAWCAPHKCTWFAVWLLNCQLLVLYCAVYITHIRRIMLYDYGRRKADGSNRSVDPVVNWEFLRAIKLQLCSSSLIKPWWSSCAMFANVSLFQNWLIVFICCPELSDVESSTQYLILSIRWHNNWMSYFSGGDGPTQQQEP